MREARERLCRETSGLEEGLPRIPGRKTPPDHWTSPPGRIPRAPETSHASFSKRMAPTGIATTSSPRFRRNEGVGVTKERAGGWWRRSEVVVSEEFCCQRPPMPWGPDTQMRPREEEGSLRTAPGRVLRLAMNPAFHQARLRVQSRLPSSAAGRHFARVLCLRKPVIQLQSMRNVVSDARSPTPDLRGRCIAWLGQEDWRSPRAVHGRISRGLPAARMRKWAVGSRMPLDDFENDHRARFALAEAP